MNADRTIRVGVFSRYFPQYRDAVFARLGREPGMRFEFHAGPSPSGSFIEASQAIPIKPITIRSVSIPGTPNSISWRSGQVWAMLRGRYDAMLLTNDILGPDVWICCVLGRLLGIPTCIWGQGLSRPPSRWRDGLRRLLTTLSNSAVYYTEGGRQYWIDRRVPARKLFVAYNALDTDKQTAVRRSLTPERTRSFLAGRGLAGRTLVSFLGRLVPAKKPRVLVDLIAKAAAAVPDITAVFIGDGPERASLETRARELGVADRVHFAGAVYDEETIGGYLTSSVAMVLPAFAGLAIQHAAVYGVPVLLGRIEHNHGPEQEMVRDAETGFWCPDEDAAAFAAAVVRLIREPDLRAQMSANMINEIDSRYNTERMAQGFIDAVRYGLNCRKGR